MISAKSLCILSLLGVTVNGSPQLVNTWWAGDFVSSGNYAEGQDSTCLGVTFYGNKKTWVAMNTDSTITCSNETFGYDPLPGQGKRCRCGLEQQLRLPWPQGSEQDGLDLGEDIDCKENSKCQCNGTAFMGKDDKWIALPAYGTIFCDVEFFGGDRWGSDDERVCRCGPGAPARFTKQISKFNTLKDQSFKKKRQMKKLTRNLAKFQTRKTIYEDRKTLVQGKRMSAQRKTKILAKLDQNIELCVAIISALSVALE